TTPISTLFPYTTLFRSQRTRISRSRRRLLGIQRRNRQHLQGLQNRFLVAWQLPRSTRRAEIRGEGLVWVSFLIFSRQAAKLWNRSEEHTSELQSRENLV